jgi:hypothetical protein
MKHMAKIDITSELILQALAFPDGTTIYDIYPNGKIPNVFTFLVEHPDLPELTGEGSIPQIKPIFTADYTKRPSTWITCNWNMENE